MYHGKSVCERERERARRLVKELLRWSSGLASAGMEVKMEWPQVPCPIYSEKKMDHRTLPLSLSHERTVE